MIRFEIGKAYSMDGSPYCYVCTARKGENTKRPKVILSLLREDGYYCKDIPDEKTSFGMWTPLHDDGQKEFVYLRRNEILYATECFEIDYALAQMKKHREWRERNSGPIEINVEIKSNQGASAIDRICENVIEKRKQFEDRRQREKKDLHLAIRMEDIQPRIEAAKPSHQQVQLVKQAQKSKTEVDRQAKKHGGFLSFFRGLFSSRLKYSNISRRRVTPS